ncbi:hypothetical protein CDL15_Pgr012480 [Punica granatum]|uniref:Uncharacterized protein n=1 Tax=Punica granatum TaxID=22663 RepID=A0A218WYY8_PUNGR|nr:hypothetical protein CDL15_Pgr012480 [Punica granatum]
MGSSNFEKSAAMSSSLSRRLIASIPFWSIGSKGTSKGSPTVTSYTLTENSSENPGSLFYSRVNKDNQTTPVHDNVEGLRVSPHIPEGNRKGQIKFDLGLAETDSNNTIYYRFTRPSEGIQYVMCFRLQPNTYSSQ